MLEDAPKFGLRYCTARYVDAKVITLAQAAGRRLVAVDGQRTIVPDGYASAYPYDPAARWRAAATTFRCHPLIGCLRRGGNGQSRLATSILILPQHNLFSPPSR
jgi:hypothetical protein